MDEQECQTKQNVKFAYIFICRLMDNTQNVIVKYMYQMQVFVEKLFK